jgi:hypothetical protein
MKIFQDFWKIYEEYEDFGKFVRLFILRFWRIFDDFWRIWNLGRYLNDNKIFEEYEYFEEYWEFWRNTCKSRRLEKKFMNWFFSNLRTNQTHRTHVSIYAHFDLTINKNPTYDINNLNFVEIIVISLQSEIHSVLLQFCEFHLLFTLYKVSIESILIDS